MKYSFSLSEYSYESESFDLELSFEEDKEKLNYIDSVLCSFLQIKLIIIFSLCEQTNIRKLTTNILQQIL